MAMQDTPGVSADPPADAPAASEGADIVHQGASLPPTDWAPILDALSLPQRRYLAAVQAGAGLEEALVRAGASPDRLHRWLRESWQFVRAHDAIQAGMAVLGVPTSRSLAAADMPDLVGHWSWKARHADRDRDQATFGRLISDVSGATGQGALVQVAVQATVQVAPSPAPHQPGGIIEGGWREPSIMDTVRAHAPVDQEQVPGRDTADAERTDDEHRTPTP